MWIPGGAVKLGDGDVFEVFPRCAVVLRFVQSAIGSQNACLRSQPLQVVFVGMHLVRPPFRPHQVPICSAIDGIPEVHPKDGDVIGIEGVDAHLGEVPSESAQGVFGDVVFRNDGAPGLSSIGRAIQVVQLAVLSHHKGIDALGRVGQSDASTLACSPGVGQDLPIDTVVVGFPNAAVGTPDFATSRIARSLPCCGVDGFGFRVVQQVRHTRRIIGEQHLVPIHTSIHAAEQAAVGVWLGRISHGTREEHWSFAFLTGHKQQFADHTHGVESHVLPRFAAIQ